MKKLILLLGVCTAMIVQAQNLSTMIACYPMDCDNVTNYANTGAILNGIPHNLACTNGRPGTLGQAYKFNGTVSSFAELPYAPGLLNGPNICVAGWYKFNNLSPSQYLVYAKNNCTQNFEAYSLAYGGSNSPYLYVIKNGGPNGGLFCVGPPPVGNWKLSNATMPAFATGVWYHIVFFVGDSKIWLYVNNIYQGQVNIVSNIEYDPNNLPVILGGSGNTTINGFNLPFYGEMQDISFYSSELTANDVNSLYTSPLNCNGQPKLTGLDSKDISDVKIGIFPNPNQGKFVVESSETIQIKVMDISGKEVAFDKLSNTQNSSEITIKDAAAGLYLVKMFNTNGELIKTQKISIVN